MKKGFVYLCVFMGLLSCVSSKKAMIRREGLYTDSISIHSVDNLFVQSALKDIVSIQHIRFLRPDSTGMQSVESVTLLDGSRQYSEVREEKKEIRQEESIGEEITEEIATKKEINKNSPFLIIGIVAFGIILIGILKRFI